MCGMSSASYVTVTGAVSPGIFSPVSVAGPALIITLAVRPPAVVAVSVAVAVPVGGV